MKVSEIVKIQQDLYRLWLRDHLENDYDYGEYAYTAQQTINGLQLKRVSVKELHGTEEYVQMSVGYYNTWLSEASDIFAGTSSIFITTYIGRTWRINPISLIYDWKITNQRYGFKPTYTQEVKNKKNKLIAVEFITHGSDSVFKNALDSWGEVYKYEHDRIFQKYNGKYKSTSERVHLLWPRIQAVYHSTIWDEIKELEAKSRYHCLWDTYILRSSEIAYQYITWDETTSWVCEFKELGYNDLKDADELVAFAVALFCRFNNMDLSLFEEKAEWDAVVKEYRLYKRKQLTVNNPILKVEKPPVTVKEEKPLKNIF